MKRRILLEPDAMMYDPETENEPLNSSSFQYIWAYVYVMYMQNSKIQYIYYVFYTKKSKKKKRKYRIVGTSIDPCPIDWKWKWEKYVFVIYSFYFTRPSSYTIFPNTWLHNICSIESILIEIERILFLSTGDYYNLNRFFFYVLYMLHDDGIERRVEKKNFKKIRWINFFLLFLLLLIQYPLYDMTRLIIYNSTIP